MNSQRAPISVSRKSSLNGALEDEQRFLVTLQCTDKGHHWMTLPVETPKHRERSGYMRELGVTLALLNQQFEKLEEDE